MKSVFYFILFALLFCSCKKSITSADIFKINGYWEIEKVILANGDVKDYKINQTIDYFQIKDNTGFRKKVTPKLNGRYLVNNQQEDIKITNLEHSFYINYTTNFSNWKEEIIVISDNELILKNNQNIQYKYKRPIPFTIK